MSTGSITTPKSIKMISIDDKTLTTDLDRAGYRKMGVFVKPASNYEEARRILTEDSIDIILINMDYKPIDGPAICRHFKSSEQTSTIPIVMTSVRTAAKIRNSALDAGADLFVEQPLPRTAFIERIKQMLEHKTRSTERVPINSDVEVITENGTFSCPVIDLSISGVLVATDKEIDDGTVVDLELDLPGQKNRFKAKGEVVRTITFSNEKKLPYRTGIGIRFNSFYDKSEEYLQKYIENSAMSESEMHYYL
jgi:uncharacterized protein (TIGR02266 family)